MPGSGEPASGVCSACGEACGATDSFCEACGTGLASVALAQQSGNENTAKLLARVVDAASGTVRLKKAENVEDADEMALDTRSTKTVRARKQLAHQHQAQ
jgi:von Willebrand factor type A C-terminal domain